MNREVLAKLGAFKVTKITGEKDGKPYEFYSASRSYKTLEGEWKDESVTLRPAEMVMMAELLNTACAKLIADQTKAQNERFANPAPQNDFISDDIPF